MRNLLHAVCRLWTCGHCSAQNGDDMGSCGHCSYQRGYQRVVPYEE